MCNYNFKFVQINMKHLLFRYLVICVLLVLQSWEKESWLLYFKCFLDVLCFSAFYGSSHDAVGWSAVSDRGIS